MNTSQYRGYSPTAKFLSVSDKEMKEMIDHILEQRQILSGRISMVGQICEIVPYYEFTFGIIQKVLEFINDEESLHEQLMKRQIDRAITKLSINRIKAEIKVIETHIKRIEDIKLTLDDRKIEVPVVFSSCQKILNEFSNKEHIFYMHPLITSPFLIAFSQLYTIVCTYGIELIPTYKEIVENEINRLKEVIEDYKTNTIKERLKMINVVQMLKVPYYEGNIIDNMVKLIDPGNFKNIFNNLKNDAKLLKLHEVDIVQDGFGFDSKNNELHYWDRTFWDQKQQFSNNYEYSMVVRIEYEQYFDKVIDTIY
jgi:hypothetical protein